ncbi:MAG: hypothetical protein F6K00_33715 [Leptolyngbya sp. SIOISBB]|nr:hypothetical protein [Leptolyngbya sp. SIOISBB]
MTTFHAPSTGQFQLPHLPRVKEEDIKPLLVAEREIVFFRLHDSGYHNPESGLTDYDNIFVREVDAVCGVTSSAIQEFLVHRQESSSASVPESVWVNNRVVTPIPFVEAVLFWSSRAHDPSNRDRWCEIVNHELERLEELVYNVFFTGFEVPEDEQWTLEYRSFDGGLTAMANNTSSLGPRIYAPGPVEGVPI